MTPNGNLPYSWTSKSTLANIYIVVDTVRHSNSEKAHLLVIFQPYSIYKFKIPLILPYYYIIILRFTPPLPIYHSSYIPPIFHVPTHHHSHPFFPLINITYINLTIIDTTSNHLLLPIYHSSPSLLTFTFIPFFTTPSSHLHIILDSYIGSTWTHPQYQRAYR